MKKTVLVAFIALGLITGGYIFYRSYFPKLVARAIVADHPPEFLPGKLKKKIEAVRSPVNDGAEDVVRRIHQSEIPLNKILTMIDNMTEDQAYSLLDELNHTKLQSTDQAFDIAIKYLHTDFNPEILRKPFSENINLKMINKGIQFMNTNRKDVDIGTAKEIAKKILVEKEKELKKF